MGGEKETFSNQNKRRLEGKPELVKLLFATSLENVQRILAGGGDMEWGCRFVKRSPSFLETSVTFVLIP